MGNRLAHCQLPLETRPVLRTHPRKRLCRLEDRLDGEMKAGSYLDLLEVERGETGELAGTEGSDCAALTRPAGGISSLASQGHYRVENDALQGDW